MSRIVKQSLEYEIAYGVDSLSGLFIQVFERNGDGVEEPIVNLDKETSPHLEMEHIVEIAEEYGFDISNELEKSTIDYGD